MTREACTEYLVERGWSQHAAEGISAWLDLDGPQLNVGCWSCSAIGKLRDWAGSHERNANYVTTQLAYIDYALRNTHEQIGRDLDAAADAAEAQEAAAPYFKIAALAK
jgi:hypothetical protein